MCLQVFWERHKELRDFEKVLANIRRGEEKIARQESIMAMIKDKLGRYKNPWQELKVGFLLTAEHRLCIITTVLLNRASCYLA
jgi:hypothetical protein